MHELERKNAAASGKIGGAFSGFTIYQARRIVSRSAAMTRGSDATRNEYGECEWKQNVQPLEMLSTVLIVLICKKNGEN